MWWEIMKFKKAEILKIFSSKIFRFIVFRPLTTKKNFKSFSLLIWKPPIFQFEIFLPNRVKKDFAFCCLLNRLVVFFLITWPLGCLYITVKVELLRPVPSPWRWPWCPFHVTISHSWLKKSRYGASIQSRSRTRLISLKIDFLSLFKS